MVKWIRKSSVALATATFLTTGLVYIYLCLRDEGHLVTSNDVTEGTGDLHVDLRNDKPPKLLWKGGGSIHTRVGTVVVNGSDSRTEHVPGGGGWDTETLGSLGRATTLLYCNSPPGDDPPSTAPTPPTQEGDAPAGYVLHSVHVIIRHGDRTSMYRLPNHVNPGLDCLLRPDTAGPLQDDVKDFIDAMADLKGSSTVAKMKARFGAYPRNPTCIMGAQLTALGSLQQIRSGRDLREIYVDKLKFLSEKPGHSEVYVRSTEVMRTVQSALAFLHAFLPKADLARLWMESSASTAFCSSKYTGVACSCPMVKRLQNIYKLEVAKKSTTREMESEIKEEVAEILETEPGKLPWTQAILEVFTSYACHQKELPCSAANDELCITWPLLGKMWHVLESKNKIETNSFASQKHSRLQMHPLLHEITNRMLNVTRGHTDPKFVLYSGHDITLSPLIKALGISDVTWPPYASRLVFELYSSPENQFYIRVLFNGAERTKDLQFCKKEDDLVSGMCPLDNFVYFVRYDDLQFFGKKSYSDACAVS